MKNSLGFWCKVIALIVPLARLGVEQAAAQSDELQLKRTFGLRGEGTSHVQMRAVMAPVKPSPESNRMSQIAVTPVLTVVSKDKVGHVCKLGPRITDALLRMWFEKPIVMANLFDPAQSGERVYRVSKTPEQQVEDTRLIKEINKALRDELISEILVVKGVRQMGGGTISKLPFASVLGCAELEEAP